MHKKFKKCTLFDNFKGCFICGRNCNDGSLSIDCTLCCKSFHRKCKKLTIKQFNDAIQKKSFCCSDRCHISFLPFHNSNDVELASAIWGDGLDICKICRNDCLDDMQTLHCLVCGNLHHINCVYVNTNDRAQAIMFRRQFVCSKKCHQHLIPFSNVKNSDLLKANIICPMKRECIPTSEKPPTLDKKHHKFLKLDQFININCSYLSPNDLNPETISKSKSDFTVFHNNIRSLNKNFESISDIFRHSKELPNVLAFSETRLNQSNSAPNLEGYSFESVNSSTSAGGVGAYISNSNNFTVNSGLAMNLQHCEDL